MKATRAVIILLAVLLLSALTALTQTPASDKNHFEKDGLSFDYPAGWQISDQSTAQIQIIQIQRGDGYAELRVRAPRAWLKSPQKEAEAKRLIQDSYLDQFTASLQQGGLQPTRSNATTEIGGGPAEGARVRAVLDGEPGGMDSYYRVISDRFVQLSEIGAERDMTKSAPAWDMIRNSIKVEPPPQPKASPQTTPKPSPTPVKP
jgi:hypothetical protein